MPSIEEIFDTAVATRVIPGAIVAASSTDGLYKYAKSFGLCSLKEDDGPHPLGQDAVLWLGSCTKLLTSIAALQCVEKGHFALDEDVTRLVPELRGIQIQPKPLDGSEPPEPVLAKNTITLRHLLNHTSGLSYTKFGQLTLPLIDRCLAPLVFEPGEGFMYGTGTDFAGLMVQRVTGLSLETYIKQHVTGPLGIQDVCFRPHEYPDMLRRLPDVSLRKARPGPLEWTDNKVWPLDTAEDSGGSGAYMTVVDYQKIIHSITANDGALLQSDMIDEMFKPDMNPNLRRDVMKVLENETTNNMFGGLPMGTEVSYAIGGMVVLEDLPGRRPKGTLHWGGLLNVFFWMDRVNGLSGIFGSQVFPAGDPDCLGLFAEFERKAYEGFREAKAKASQ